MKEFILIFFISIICSQFTNAQVSKFRSSPRQGKNASAKGYYDLVVRVNNTIVNRREDLIVEIYVTGYGQIRNAKFVFYPSISIIDEKKSTMMWDLKRVDSYFLGGESTYLWGKDTMNIKDVGVFIDLSGGIVNSKWNEQEPTIFFDYRKSITTPQIMTEIRTRGIAPIVLKLHILKNASPGNHFLHFGFTYFNGEEWMGSNHMISFTISNFFQEKENLIKWVGGIIALLTFLVTGITLYDRILKGVLQRKLNSNSVAGNKKNKS